MKHLVALFLALALVLPAAAQDSGMDAGTFAGLSLRNIGPALMSGRIADIAVHPTDYSVWYVAVGSGGVWKTENAGTTWKPVFDAQPVYSIGSLALDPNNPETVWVGTGENVGGRHAGFGDGIYRSDDGGASWTNMGLPESEHLSTIIVHPENSDVVWVASQGPLWSPGGERGVYMTTDGGATWTRTLGDDEWVGATDLVIDPRNPDRLYAATWQRHRTVAAYMGGGPGTALYRSDDGGLTWKKLNRGLPGSNMGKIGLAISPQQPDVVYAVIELDRRTGGLWRSENRGESWTKMSDTVSGATGPHYYQELYASPHKFDRLYLMDTSTQISEDGGRTFRRISRQHAHVDDHALAFRPDDPNWLLLGTDGGLYESFDLAGTWRFNANLPVTQFYKLAVDDSEPFYMVYGGTQDNSTQGGPSRTDNHNGIRNADWFITLGGDGHQPATEPGNPDIIYSQSQQGNYARVDLTTGQTVSIRPQPALGEPFERFNWDAPILVSENEPSRIYVASQRVWRSEDRGDSWTALSGDLTRDEERIELPIMGRQQSWDEPWDFLAMSTYNTIANVGVSMLDENIIYAGTDDGLLSITEDGGASWRTMEVSEIRGVPAMAYVNHILPDRFDARTVYMALDNHKNGDYAPYLVKSTDAGRTWTSLAGTLGEQNLVWRIAQDHEKSDLLFLGTEFGLYFTLDGGDRWIELTGGVPTISFRDVLIQRRENDVVGGTFGRGIYILDDYSVLREVTPETLGQPGALFPMRDALWFQQRRTLGASSKASQGDGYYTAPNPPHGAVFTYHLAEGLESLKAQRKAAESELGPDDDVPFPGYEAVDAERTEEGPYVWLTIRDASGQMVRRIEGATSKGFHRVAWDMRGPSTSPLRAGSDANRGASGYLAPPGTYSVELSTQVGDEIAVLDGPVDFRLVPLYDGALPGSTPDQILAYADQVDALINEAMMLRTELSEAGQRVNTWADALARSTVAPGDLDTRLYAMRESMMALDRQAGGIPAKGEVGEKQDPTFMSHLFVARGGTSNWTYGPTQTHQASLEAGRAGFAVWKDAVRLALDTMLPALEEALREAGVPEVY